MKETLIIAQSYAHLINLFLNISVLFILYFDLLFIKEDFRFSLFKSVFKLFNITLVTKFILFVFRYYPDKLTSSLNKVFLVEIMSESPGEMGGFKEVICKVSGDGVYGIMKFESGGHRLQRVPVTETQGRVHTSACTVMVFPEVPESEAPKIDPKDIRIDTFRSSGAGGQHINKTDSAIRITHFPTGIVVECQDERSQHRNKEKAFAVLAARLARLEEEKRAQEKSEERQSILSSGDRSDRIRTYNYPQGRVSDHRINLTLYRLDEIMNGDLDALVMPVIEEHQAAQLAELAKAN